MISEGEILDAIRRPLWSEIPGWSKTSYKSRNGKMSVRFCSPRTMEILSRELGISMEEITKTGGDSRLIEGINKKNCRGGREP